jgi:hypothetical protein
MSFDNLWSRRKDLLMVPDDPTICGIGESAIFDVPIVRGLCVIPLQLNGTRVSDECILVSKQHYENGLAIQCNAILESILVNINTNLNSKISINNPKCLSFTSFYDSIEAQISFLFDATISQRNDMRTYPALTFASDVKLDQLYESGNYDETMEILEYKYAKYFGTNTGGLLDYV